VTCTPARGAVLQAPPRADAFVAAVGAFTPDMLELGPEFCRHCADRGRVVLDTSAAVHEAGDLLQAGLDMASFGTLGELMATQPPSPRAPGPVLFKSCGWAGWDLAAARLALK
jgi:ornithine cyclodeaminase